MFWFTSDQHFGHSNILKYCNRPFENVFQMNECIIENHNDLVRKNDYVFHLGDFCFHTPIQYLKKLNGKHFLIRGNHDAHSGLEPFEWVNDTYILKNVVPDFSLFLSHYAHRVWPHSHYGTGHLFGHSHGKLEPYGRSFDVGVDTNNFKPYSLEEILDKMATLKPIFLVKTDPIGE